MGLMESPPFISPSMVPALSQRPGAAFGDTQQGVLAGLQALGGQAGAAEAARLF